jgi:hypothetical protein
MKERKRGLGGDGTITILVIVKTWMIGVLRRRHRWRTGYQEEERNSTLRCKKSPHPSRPK